MRSIFTLMGFFFSPFAKDPGPVYSGKRVLPSFSFLLVSWISFQGFGVRNQTP